MIPGSRKSSRRYFLITPWLDAKPHAHRHLDLIASWAVAVSGGCLVGKVRDLAGAAPFDNSVSMNLRHAAALALVGWYFISSPLSWAETHAEALETFTAPDGAFTFTYTKQLVRCEYKRTVSHRNLLWEPVENCSAYNPVCDDLVNFDEAQTSVVCFAYPRNKFTDTPAFEAATFSVEIDHNSNTRKSCLAAPHGSEDDDKRGTKRINGVSFTAFYFDSVGSNQGVGVDLYRTFHNGKCYQLGINQASANAEVFDPPAKEPDWKEVERTLDRPLDSFRFLK